MAYNYEHHLINKHQLAVGIFYFYKNYIIAEVKEGMVVTHENCNDLFNFVTKYYGTTTSFVYISNRKNSYSFSPISHFKSTKLFPNLIGYGVVTYNSVNRKVALMEQKFLKTNTKIFISLEDAVLWVDELILKD